MEAFEKLKNSFDEYNELYRQIDVKTDEVKENMLKYCRQRFVGSIIIDKPYKNPDRKPDSIFVVTGIEGIEYGLYKGIDRMTIVFGGIYLSIHYSSYLQRFSDENIYCTKRLAIKDRSYQVLMETGELNGKREITLKEVSDMYDISFKDKNGNTFYMGDTIRYIDEDGTEKTGIVTGRGDCWQIQVNYKNTVPFNSGRTVIRVETGQI